MNWNNLKKDIFPSKQASRELLEGWDKIDDKWVDYVYQQGLEDGREYEKKRINKVLAKDLLKGMLSPEEIEEVIDELKDTRTDKIQDQEQKYGEK